MFDLEYLRAMAPGYDINYVPESVSTNTELMSSESARAGSVLIAGRQSAGRGRMERAFSSPEGGLYMSVLLTPANIEEAIKRQFGGSDTPNDTMWLLKNK